MLRNVLGTLVFKFLLQLLVYLNLLDKCFYALKVNKIFDELEAELEEN